MSTRTAGGPKTPAWQEIQPISAPSRPSPRRGAAPFHSLSPLRILALAGLAAMLAGLLPHAAHAYLMEPLDRGLVGVTMQLSGKSVDKVKNEASLKAVQSCVGRVFWGKDLLIAQDLLTKYLEKNHAKYVRGIETLATDFTAGRPVLTLRIYVDYASLLRDLRQKRFILVPKPRPYFKVFLAEKLGDEFAKYTTGREALTAALKDRNLHPYTEPLERPPSNVDVVADPILFEDARVSCERHDIEVLVSGSSQTTRIKQQELYYDTYYFYKTVMNVALVRVDTGETLATAEATGTASHTDEQRAIDLSITRAADQAVAKLMDTYSKVWGPMVLDQANYHLLLTGVTPQTLSLVKDSLSGFSRDSKVYERQKYDRTAVLNIVYPGKREDLMKAISTMSYPTMSVIPPVTVDGRLVGDGTVKVVEKTEIGKAVGEVPAPGQKVTYNYVFQTDLNLKLVDRGNGRTVVKVSASAKASGFDAPAVANQSWKNAASQALSALSTHFPPSIEVVDLREGSYALHMSKDLSDVGTALAQDIANESTIGQVDHSLADGRFTITLKYPEPEAKDDNLLGKDPFLPDQSIVSSTRRNYLEIQVGE